MTEEEAKTKQCPVMRGQRPVETRCIASDCMMWRWDLNLANPESMVNGLIPPQYDQSDDSGYCGLTK